MSKTYLILHEKRNKSLFTQFLCKFIKIKWELRRCWLKKLYSSLFSLVWPSSKNDSWGQMHLFLLFPNCYLLSVTQNRFRKLSTVNCNACEWWYWLRIVLEWHWSVFMTWLQTATPESWTGMPRNMQTSETVSVPLFHGCLISKS